MLVSVDGAAGRSAASIGDADNAAIKVDRDIVSTATGCKQNERGMIGMKILSEGNKTVRY